MAKVKIGIRSFQDGELGDTSIKSEMGFWPGKTGSCYLLNDSTYTLQIQQPLMQDSTHFTPQHPTSLLDSSVYYVRGTRSTPIHPLIQILFDPGNIRRIRNNQRVDFYIPANYKYCIYGQKNNTKDALNVMEKALKQLAKSNTEYQRFPVDRISITKYYLGFTQFEEIMEGAEPDTIKYKFGIIDFDLNSKIGIDEMLMNYAEATLENRIISDIEDASEQNLLTFPIDDIPKGESPELDRKRKYIPIFALEALSAKNKVHFVLDYHIQVIAF